MKIVFIAGAYTGDGNFESIEANIRTAWSELKRRV